MARLIVGLGNPGASYAQTRHNAGFLAADELSSIKLMPPFSHHKASRSLVSRRGGLIVAKPQTFMNASGKAVSSLLRFFSLSPSDLLVMHDDIDIPMGEIREGTGRGSAGHRGVESIMSAIGTKDFMRLRIGILPSEGKPGDVERFVLKPFSAGELEQLSSAFRELLPSAVRETE